MHLPIRTQNGSSFGLCSGVSMTYPPGWVVRTAVRWGDRNRENTVMFTPGEEISLRPRMYYNMYANGAPPPVTTSFCGDPNQNEFVAWCCIVPAQIVAVISVIFLVAMPMGRSSGTPAHPSSVVSRSP